MARLLTIVNERKKLRNEYRKHLEDQYIASKKAEEAKAYEDAILARREAGERTELLPEEIRNLLIAKAEKKEKQLNFVQEELIEKYEKSRPNTAGLLEDEAGEEMAVRSPLIDKIDI